MFSPAHPLFLIVAQIKRFSVANALPCAGANANANKKHIQKSI